MKRFVTSLFITLLAINSFAQFVYPDPPKSTNDATIIGGLRYPYHFKFEGNPVSRWHGAADPDVQVWGDTIWVYTSQDRKMIPGVHESHYDAMDGYHVFSTTDLVNWTNHGEVIHSKDISWANGGFLWAPGSARKNGKYYLYYPVKDKQLQWKIGVAIGDTPIGPFKDTGKPMAGIGGIDPKIFIDDNGEAFIYNNSAIVAKLKPNMIELAEPTRKIVYGSNEIMNNETTKFAEGSYMHKNDGIYYYSYSNWHNKTDQGFYAMGTSPYGPFEWKGALAPNPAGAQDHHSIVEFKGQWYYFYHIAINGQPKYKESQGRIFCFDRLYYNKDGTIQKVVHTQGPTKILKTNAPNGSVILTPPGGAYAPGTTVKVTAKSDLGYAFDGWNGDLSGSTNPATIKMDADKSVSASFVVTTTYTLSTNSANGSVMLNPSGGVYNSGDEVLLTPNKVFGYKFSSWSGDLTGSAVPGKIIMNSNKSVTANYVLVPTYKITADAKNGIIELNPPGGVYEEGTVVTMKAKQDFGYKFTGWTGDISDTKNPVSVVVNADKKITANFVYAGNEKIVFATNCGGEAFRSDEGVYYTADSKYAGGGTYSGGSAISGTVDDALYVKERNGNTFSYKIPLPNKEYKVTLMFAEIFHDSQGKRVFDVFIEGVKVSSNLDIWTKVGKNAAYNETHVVKVSDGELNISFTTIKDNAKISAIKVTEAAPVTGLNDLPSALPKCSEIGQNYPNPFQTGTTIPYRLYKPSQVRLSILNYLGQQVALLVNEFQYEGKYSAYWDAKNNEGRRLGSGLYMYRMETEHNTVLVGKLLIKSSITSAN
jgi:arabinoxylan arabinofuranohydrolase